MRDISSLSLAMNQSCHGLTKINKTHWTMDGDQAFFEAVRLDLCMKWRCMATVQHNGLDLNRMVLDTRQDFREWDWTRDMKDVTMSTAGYLLAMATLSTSAFRKTWRQSLIDININNNNRLQSATSCIRSLLLLFTSISGPTRDGIFCHLNLLDIVPGLQLLRTATGDNSKHR